MSSGRLDLERIGVLGQSLGGLNVMKAAALDSRIRAGVNEDWPGGGSPVVEQPFLFMGTSGSYRSATGPAYHFRATGFHHSDYSDVVCWPEWNVPGYPVNDDCLRTTQIVNAYILAFFDEYLKGEEQPLLDGPSDEYPEVEIQSRNTE